MPTMKEIRAKYKGIHDGLSDQFYFQKSIDKMTFDTLHAKCWNDMQQELLDNGYLQRRWNYHVGATISTAVGDFELNVVIDSPIELTPQQVQNNLDLVKNADWTLKDTSETLVET
ncbi:MAG: hypothetical protein NWE79_08590 [Candidatus Bathyarchaeota archaeon]|nr:hypothetical protein [Candidatus Bathyarchaeota archaeon]